MIFKNQAKIMEFHSFKILKFNGFRFSRFECLQT